MRKVVIVSAFVVVALIASLLHAEDSPYTVVRAQDLIGKPVKNRGGADLGRVEDYVIDVRNNNIVYGVLQYGDTLGFGGKLFAVPPQALSLAPDQKAVLFDAEKNDLESAAGFDANKWPTEPEARWGQKSKDTSALKDDARKDDPSRVKTDKDSAKKDEDRAAHLRRVTSLMGASIKNTRGEDLGSLQGIVFDMKASKVLYGALNRGGVAGIGGKYFAIPWDAMTLESPTLKAGDRAFVLDASPAELDKAPGFDAKAWPTSADDSFSKDPKKDQPKP